MVARSKVVTAKWGVPSKEPEDLPDFLSNEEIEEAMGGAPRGVFRLWVKKITVVKNKNDDDMLKITAEIFETAKDKKGYNGWVFWENQNVTEQGASFLKQFLKSIGATWADFEKRTKLINQNSATEPTEIVAIGPVNFAGKTKVLAKATTRMGKAQNGYEAKMEVGRWVPKDSDDDESEDIEDEDEDLGEDEDLDEEDVEEVDGDDEELEDDDEEETELREELDGLSLPDLRKRVKTNDADAKTTGLKKAALIDLIVEQELLLDDEEEPEDEDEDLGEDEEDPEEELRAELAELTLGALKKRAKDNGEKVAVLRPLKTKEPVIDIIVAQELEDDEEPPF
jgi:hypothetical protein